ncbi:LADA_0F08790g1_1 [Lachancea dasiensis]|uniref:LADA_0F08790g1_1 n=1 Tax=Lachancea dasiensis TaxID=1072105 RepID=A0A1G4JKX2_9SACH|nr:LADA_0F08790g1_1 [Lachancea dasiensis]
MVKLSCPFPGCQSSIVGFEADHSTVLPVDVYKKFKIMLPSENTTVDGQFSVYGDIWDFDNVGVSRAVPDSVLGSDNEQAASKWVFTWKENSYMLGKLTKYLICADCDRGPLGMVCETMRDGQSVTLNFLSLASVRRVEEP